MQKPAAAIKSYDTIYHFLSIIPNKRMVNWPINCGVVINEDAGVEMVAHQQIIPDCLSVPSNVLKLITGLVLC